MKESVIFTLALTALLAGCASTTVETSGTPLGRPLCASAESRLPVAIYWMPRWRPDQKEPAAREALAQRGIEDFVARHPCLTLTALERLPAGAGVPSDVVLRREAAALNPPPERVVLIVVRELGPRLLIGLPMGVEGGTEVVIEVRVLDPAATAPLADARTQWRNGGKFVVKGVRSLERDMSAALAAALMSPVAAY
ncbi:MAG: hypothetical protein AMXMBFR76_12530 [Pseudomonadota bacterium]